MAKLTLTTITSGYASNSALNDNFDLIETALENTLSRDGTSPNSMSANLDMNGYRILNELATSGSGFIWASAWVTGTAYVVNNLVRNSGTTYICLVAHTSGTFATDLTALKWEIFAQKGDAGAGTGDVLAANNGSEYTATAATFRGNVVAAKSGANSDITSLSGLSTPLSVAQGGVGAATLTANNVLLGNGTSALQAVAPSTSGNVLTSNGTTWTSAAPASGSAGIAGETTYNTNTTLSLTTDNTYLIRCTSAYVVYTFPAATSNEGKYWWITNQTATDTAVRLVANGAESIGGATGATIYIPAYTTIGFVSDGAKWLVFQYSGKRIWTFTANGTWYCPPGIYRTEVDGSGGGGGGGGGFINVDAFGGGGGGSGAVAKGEKLTTVPGTAYTVTIGGGGAGGASTTGSSGGATSLGALLSLSGGSPGVGGTASTNSGGAPGTGGVGGVSSSYIASSAGGAGGNGAHEGANADSNTGGGGGGGVPANSTGGNGGSGYLRIRA